MLNRSAFGHHIWLVWSAAFVLAVVLALAVLWSVGLGGFLVLAVAGGSVLGSFFFLTNRRRRPPTTVPDRFARDAFSTDTLNFAHVRVTGIGGLGLLVVAVAVAADLALVRAVLVAGLIGGVVAATAIIMWRRRSGPLPSSSTGPRARGVLFSETIPDVDPVPSNQADEHRPHRAAVTVPV